MKKFSILAGLLFLFTVVFCISNASAQISQDFHYVTIHEAGPFFDKTIILVSATDGSFAYKWLELSSTNDKAMLATALTAISNGSTVRVWVMNDLHTLAGLSVQTAYSVLIAP